MRQQLHDKEVICDETLIDDWIEDPEHEPLITNSTD